MCSAKKTFTVKTGDMISQWHQNLRNLGSRHGHYGFAKFWSQFVSLLWESLTGAKPCILKAIPYLGKNEPRKWYKLNVISKIPVPFLCFYRHQLHLKLLVQKSDKASLSCAMNQLSQTALGCFFSSFLLSWLKAPVICQRQLALFANPSASDNGTISSSTTA